MLSRTSSDAVRIQNEQALAAATTAFVRAHAGDAAEKAKNQTTDLSRTKSNASHKSQGSHLQSSHFPRRQSNSRTMQPQKSTQAALVRRKSYAPPEATEKFPDFCVSPGSSDAAMSSQPSMVLNENIRPSSQPKMQRPSASSSVASQQIRKARSMYYASSIQTGSPLARPPAKYLATPPTLSPAPDNSLLSTRSVDGYFQRPRSSAISPLDSPRLPATIAPDESVAIARDKYLQDFQQQRQAKHKPSLLLGPFKKRQDKGKSKVSLSVGNFSFGGQRTPVDLPPGTSLNDIGSQKGKRSISNSLKHKFKKVFRRSSKLHLPIQQIEANRNYFSGYTSKGDPSPAMRTTLSIPSPDQKTLQRHTSRTPLLDVGHPTFIRPNSRGSSRSGHSARSNRSLHSEAGTTSNATTSRVTSWGNSSAGGTLTQRDIKRLTVIHETKDSIGSEVESSKTSRPPKERPPPIPGFAAFRRPMPINGLMKESTTPIDPKRVFSALMKEIDASNNSPSKGSSRQSLEGDVFISQTARDLSSYTNTELRSSGSRDRRASESSDLARPPSRRRPESLSAQSKSGSVKSRSLRSLGRALEATIRTVTPTEKNLHASPTPSLTASVRDTVRIPRPSTANSKSSAISTDDNGNREHVLDSTGSKIPVKAQIPNDFQSPTTFTPTIEQIESQTQKPHGRWKKKLDENTTLTCSLITSQAYSVDGMSRKALSQKVSGDSHPSKLFAEAENRHMQTERQPPASPLSPRSNPQSVFSPLSPSVYSRNTDGSSILPNDSVMSFDGKAEDDRNGSGSSVIITGHTVKSYVVGSPSQQRDISSTRSSRDWKAWLSHEISELDNSLPDDVSIQDHCKTPTGLLATGRELSTPTRHHREFTQIAEDEITMIGHELESPPVPMPVRQSRELEAPRHQSIPIERTSSRKPSSNSLAPPQSLEDSQTQTSRDSSSGLQARSTPKQRRISSIQSQNSSIMRPKMGSPSSSMMNDRFPYIDTGRRSSTASSARISRHAPSFTGSGSSSLGSTPSAKVYSDFSAPGTSKLNKRGSHLRLKGSGSVGIEADKENLKENLTPMLTNNVKRPGVVESPPVQCLVRPKSLQSLPASCWNRASSSLAQYTTSHLDIKDKQSPLASRTTTPRKIRSRVSHISPGKLTTRPKSAFDLRNTKSTTPDLPLTPANFSGNGSLGGRKMYHQRASTIQRKPITGPALEGQTLRMLLDSSWVESGPVSPICTSEERHRPSLHIKSSSSTLALNREPSPGTETRVIDTVLGYFEGTEDERGLTESSGRSVTPGQRMAERFLRERMAGSGRGSPVSDKRENVRSVTGSPAFV
jgi:hypothetical protein